MKNLTLYLVALIFLFVTKVLGQETFESKAKKIANKIEKVTKEEKAALKEEVEAVNVQLSEGKITQEQADKRKKELAEARATIIEEKVTLAQNELNDLEYGGVVNINSDLNVIYLCNKYELVLLLEGADL